MSGPTLELHDIQGGVLRGYGYPFATYLMVRTDDPGEARAWLAGLLADVTSAQPWRADKPELSINIALTAPGIEAFGMSAEGFPGDFRDGMRARADRLGDTGHNHPRTWDPGLSGRGDGHVLVWIQGRLQDAVRDRVDAFLADLAGDQAGEVVFRQDAAALPFGREHFGFADGFAQPSVAGSGQENRPGEGVPKRFGRWRLLRPGEIVLGYEDEDGILPPAPPAPLHRNGTFMVLRKLEQHVAEWRRWLRETAAQFTGGDEQWLGAKVVGRWEDGTPMALAPERPQRRSLTGLREINAFDFGHDAQGLACPAGAHIRRVNGRSGLAGGADRTRRHRIIRRGMPYGPPLHGDTADDQERGLLFACFNASIARQFEIVQHWSVDGNVFALGSRSRDFLAGAGDGTEPFTIPGDPPLRVPGPQTPLVTVRGGEYLFVPSLSGLRAIAEGRT